MKFLSLISICMLAACVNRPTIDELEHEALLTGDWTKVEQRERLVIRAATDEGQRCPEGFVLACFEQGPLVDCKCLRPAGGRF